MIIEFLLSGIKDKSKLYETSMVPDRFAFGDSQGIEITQYIGDQYCSSAISLVTGKLSDIVSYEYKGSKDRIANEVFELSSSAAKYTVSCTIDTYHNSKSRMLVKIESEDKRDGTNSETQTESDLEYDQVLEKLKIEVKGALKEDWNSCVWIRDEQSELLCSWLYPLIFRAENGVRAFANKVLISELGTNWIASPGLEKYAESHESLSKVFRSKEPAFSDVDDVFISATLETLFEIIQHGVVYESPFQLPQNQFNELVKLAAKKADVVEWLKKKRAEKKNIWKDIFEPFFVATKNYQQIITDFILNRNHIAHNKPITLSGYHIMEKSFSDFDKMVTQANQKFEESVPSEELYLTIDLENEQAREQAEREEYERNYLRDRIFGETGIEILWHDDIYDQFVEKCNTLYQTYYDLFYWDNKFRVSSMNAMEDTDQWQSLFSIYCSACEKYYLEIQVALAIDDDMDGDSELLLRYVQHGGGKTTSSTDCGVASAIHYHNGCGSENVSEGTIDLSSESSWDESELDNFLEQVDEELKTLNPYIAIKEEMEFLAAKEGGDLPVADFSCCECGEQGVSVRNDFYKFGHCCYCGAENEVFICERCGTHFGDGSGNAGLCNSCIEYLEKE